MVRGRKSKYKEPYRQIMREGSHKSEINRHVQVHEEYDDSTLEEVEQQIRAIRKQIKRMHKIANRENRSLTTKEYYQKQELKGIIKKLNKVKKYIEEKPNPECIHDEKLKDVTTAKLNQQIENLNDIRDSSTGENNIKSIEKNIRKIGKELQKRKLIKKPLRDLFDEDKIIYEFDDDSTSIAVTDSSDGNINVYSIDTDHEESKPTTFIPPTDTNDKIEKFFKEIGEPITPTTAEEIIKKEKEEKPIKARKQNYKGYNY